MKAIIDTNIAIDLMQKRDGFVEDAAKVFTICAGGLVEGFFTPNSICDIHYILKKYLHDEKEVRRCLSSWLDIINIVDLKPEDIVNAVESDMSDYEDAVIAATAKRNRIDFIITRNTKDFKESPVPALTPSQFVETSLKAGWQMDGINDIV